jgi:sulfatase maturation enzyme AslB (radical SAM superfamily)
MCALTFNTSGVSDIAKNGNIRMCVSLDGHTKELHEHIRGKNTFDVTIKNIISLIKSDVDVEIIHTVNALSCEYILELVNFLKKIGIRKLNLHKVSLKGNALEHQGLGISPTTWRKLIERLKEHSLLSQNQSITVRYEMGYATLKEYEILNAQDYHPHSSGSFYSQNGHRVIIYPDGKVYISSEAFGTESFIGAFENDSFVPNISDASELKLSQSTGFDVSFLNSDLQGDNNFPIALSVSFRKSLLL